MGNDDGAQGWRVPNIPWQSSGTIRTRALLSLIDAQYWMVSPFPPEAVGIKPVLFRQAALGDNLRVKRVKNNLQYADSPPHDHVFISLGGEYAALAK